ncbi:hypothetical protein JCM19274_762 [Algibacter lectus]|uniref:Uncharacterized protein n=1 Tax=Algibacter lectus TaxID=221126 RepID=A0A090X611_9FLAO|nr:hypothetical protein JCM19274_762 [Algibacter lectus]
MVTKRNKSCFFIVINWFIDKLLEIMVDNEFLNFVLKSNICS